MIKTGFLYFFISVVSLYFNFYHFNIQNKQRPFWHKKVHPFKDQLINSPVSGSIYHSIN